MTLPLSGKVALVTGASRGIGAAIAKRFAADGASVVVNYKGSKKLAEDIVQSINDGGIGKAVAVQANLAVVEEGRRLVEETVKAFGGVDILVLNASSIYNTRLEETTEDQYDDAYNTNVKVPLFMIKAAAPYLKSGGRVFFISSGTTKMTDVSPDFVLYCGSKGSIEQMTRVLAKDLGARGVTVNCIGPGPIDTDMMYEHASMSTTDNAGRGDVIDRLAKAHPMKRLGRPDEVAPIVAFWAREEAAWVNGQKIFVDNGVFV